MLITNELRNQIIESREAGEPRAQTVRRIGLSSSTYDLTVQAYKAARRGDTDALDKIAKQSATVARWAFGFVCVHPPQKFPPVPAALTPAALESPLTLEKCTKPELIEIVRKIVSICGNAAEATLELELVRCECMRMLDTLAKLKEEAMP